jgi:hypothetical protein
MSIFAMVMPSWSKPDYGNNLLILFNFLEKTEKIWSLNFCQSLPMSQFIDEFGKGGISPGRYKID